MTYLLGVAGGSGSGKGTIAKLIMQHLVMWGLSCGALSTDDCYKDFSHLNEAERDDLCFNPEKNYDHPSSVNFDRLTTFAGRMKRGEPFSFLTYNFKTHTYDANSETINVPDNLDVGIIEGNYALYSGSELTIKLPKLYDRK